MNLLNIIAFAGLIINLPIVSCQKLPKFEGSLMPIPVGFGAKPVCDPPCGGNSICILHPMSTTSFCDCNKRFAINPETAECEPDLEWCNSAADCDKDGQICCRYRNCDGPKIHRCKKKEYCSMAGCANGIDVDENN